MNLSQNYHFSGQKEGEQIILIVRRHWFNILENLFSVLMMVALLIGSFLFLPFLFPASIGSDFNGAFVFLENLFAMAIWILFFLVWIDYYFDVWIITNKRIVNVEQKGLFSRNVSELELEKIQDVTTEVMGVIPTFLNYGNVYIQTAAEKERFVFADVADPYRIKDLVMNLHKDNERKENSELGEIIGKEIRGNNV